MSPRGAASCYAMRVCQVWWDGMRVNANSEGAALHCLYPRTCSFGTSRRQNVLRAAATSRWNGQLNSLRRGYPWSTSHLNLNLHRNRHRAWPFALRALYSRFERRKRGYPVTSWVPPGLVNPRSLEFEVGSTSLGRVCCVGFLVECKKVALTLCNFEDTVGRMRSRFCGHVAVSERRRPANE